MTVREERRKMSKDDIMEILRRNARLFKDEPEFVTYIVDLAIYLIENCLEQENGLSEEGKMEAPFKAAGVDLKEVHRIFDRFATGKTPLKSCPMCGCPVEGKRKCPNCNAMTF